MKRSNYLRLSLSALSFLLILGGLVFFWRTFSLPEPGVVLPAFLFYAAVLVLAGSRLPRRVFEWYMRVRETGRKSVNVIITGIAVAAALAVRMAISGVLLGKIFEAIPGFLVDLGVATLFILLLHKPVHGVSTKSTRGDEESRYRAFCFFLLYLFSPPVIYNSCCYSPVIAASLFLLLLAHYFLISGKPAAAGAVLAPALVLNLQNLLYLPFFWAYIARLRTRKNRTQGYSRKQILLTVGTGIAVFLILVVVTGFPADFVKPAGFIEPADFAEPDGSAEPAGLAADRHGGSGFQGWWTLQNARFFSPAEPGPNAVFLLQKGRTGLYDRWFYYLPSLFLPAIGFYLLLSFFQRLKNSARAGTAMLAGFFLVSLLFYMLWPDVTGELLYPAVVFSLLLAGLLKNGRVFYLSLLLGSAYFCHIHTILLRRADLLSNTDFLRATYILALFFTGLGLLFFLLLIYAVPGWKRIRKALQAYEEKWRMNLACSGRRRPFVLTRRDLFHTGGILLLYFILLIARLGVTTVPMTGMDLPRPSDSVEVVFSGPVDIDAIVYYEGENQGELEILTEREGEWFPLTTLDCRDFYKMHKKMVRFNGVERLLLRPKPAAGRLLELAFFDPEGRLIPVDSVYCSTENQGEAVVQAYAAADSPLFDEQALLTAGPSYRNSTYFDEIYHGRTAYEYLHGLPVYETTHPPLGKVILSAGIWLFGMNPFGMRIMNILAGVVLLLVLFLLAREVLYTRAAAYLALLLGFLDFMPFVQSRYSTIDTFSVLFICLMYLWFFKYVNLSGRKEQGAGVPNPWPGRAFLYAALTIFCFALGAGIKWTAVYGFGGVVICFLLLRVVEYNNYRNRRRRILEAEPNLYGDRKEKPAARTQTGDFHFWKRQTVKSILWILMLFVVIAPLAYYFPYIPYLQCSGVKEPLSREAVVKVMENQVGMYGYHSRLTSTHPFSSSWWGWPFNFRPLWLYTNQWLEVNRKEVIVSLGNPAVWWAAVAGVLAFVYVWVFRVRKFHPLVLVLIAYSSLYFPWTLISRATFIYHFYPVLPFSLLFLAAALEPLWQLGGKGRRLLLFYLAICALLFLFFYPVLSGVEVSQNYVNCLRWFPSDWIF